ncbi:MAG: glycosyltransferase family 2 protein [Candidatus Bathyarchaeia archaeon]
MPPRMSIIIPTLNEETGIEKTLQSIPDDVRKDSEVIVVDGMSGDNTVLEARKYGARVIFEGRRGKGRAMRTGAEHACGEILVFMDGDGSYPPEAIPDLIRVLDGNDLAVGNVMPYLRKIRRIELRLTYYYPSLLLSNILFSLIRIPLEDPLDGMRAIRKADFERLGLESNGFEIETEMNLKAKKLGFRIAEVPIKFHRRRGRSKFVYNLKDQLKILYMIITNFRLRYA